MLKKWNGKNRTPKGAGEPTQLEGYSGTVEALAAQAGSDVGGRLPFESIRARNALKLLLSEPNIRVLPFTGSWFKTLGLEDWDRSKNVGYKVTFSTGLPVLVVLLEAPELSSKRFFGLKRLRQRERLNELGFSALEIWCSEDVAAAVADSQIDLVRRDLFRAEQRPNEQAEAHLLQKLNAAGGCAELAKCDRAFRVVAYSLIAKGTLKFARGTPPYSRVELAGDSAMTSTETEFTLREEEYSDEVIPAIVGKSPFVRPVGNQSTLIRLAKKSNNSAVAHASFPVRSLEMSHRRELAWNIQAQTPKRGATGFWTRVQEAILIAERALAAAGQLKYPLPERPPGIRTLKRWKREFRERGPDAFCPKYPRKSRESKAWQSEAGAKLTRALAGYMRDAACQ